jgi:hypothetical protein
MRISLHPIKLQVSCMFSCGEKEKHDFGPASGTMDFQLKCTGSAADKGVSEMINTIFLPSGKHRVANRYAMFSFYHH